MKEETKASVEKMTDEIMEEVKKELLETARGILKELYSGLLEELLVSAQERRFTPSLLVSKIRDYNRKWNKEVEQKQYLIPDTFKDFAKNNFLDDPKLGEDFKKALGYL